MVKIKVLAKFECRAEFVGRPRPCFGNDKLVLMYVFYNQQGKYIGDEIDFRTLVIKRGIIPETFGNNVVCSIGKSIEDGKWYGWSPVSLKDVEYCHKNVYKAIHGFKIGDKVKKGSCCATSGYALEHLSKHKDPYVLPVGFVAKTEKDCKKMAIAFASCVA